MKRSLLQSQDAPRLRSWSVIESPYLRQQTCRHQGVRQGGSRDAAYCIMQSWKVLSGHIKLSSGWSLAAPLGCNRLHVPAAADLARIRCPETSQHCTIAKRAAAHSSASCEKLTAGYHSRRAGSNGSRRAGTEAAHMQASRSLRQLFRTPWHDKRAHGRCQTCPVKTSPTLSGPHQAITLVSCVCMQWPLCTLAQLGRKIWVS